jgi:DNA polymerase-1
VITSRRPGVATESISGVFRETLDPDYKAQRKKPDEELVRQIPLVSEAMRCLGLPVLTQADYEADDVIATVAKKSRLRRTRSHHREQ